MAQDLPPIGGYGPIQWRRNIPSRGFRPIVGFGIFVGLLGYGWYKVILGIRERRELKREKIWSRIYLQPLLIAEEDRQSVRRFHADKEREAEIMKDVKDWVPKQSVYNDGQFRDPYYTWIEPK